MSQGRTDPEIKAGCVAVMEEHETQRQARRSSKQRTRTLGGKGVSTMSQVT